MSSATQTSANVTWQPSREGCHEEEYDIPLPGSSIGEDRMRVRLTHDPSDRLIDFAVIQQTLVGASWLNVWEADARHGVTHAHLCARRLQGGRIGDRIDLKPITCFDDITDGYAHVVSRVMAGWAEHKRRWQDA